MVRKPESVRALCYECLRPAQHCFCDLIPIIKNQTHVLILQHRKERSHPFNTARMVGRALGKCTRLVGRNAELAAATLPLDPQAALLYPGPTAKQLADLAPHQRPKQLVILDGTWHHSKTLLRDIPAIGNLPRYGLTPGQPGQYRIRLEPTDTSLSTVEATVAALRLLEPHTIGLDRLLDAFNSMVERQLSHPQARYEGLTLAQRERLKPNIPQVLIHDFDNVVVMYGESAGGERAASVKQGQIPRRTPVYWVAQRLGTGEKFQAVIDPGPGGLSDQQLEHLQLPAAFFDEAVSHARFRQLWSAFVREEDTLAVYHPSTLALLASVGLSAGPSVALKCVDLNPGCRNGKLEQVLKVNQLVPAPVGFPGRAGIRLAGVVTFAKHLQQLGKIAKRVMVDTDRSIKRDSDSGRAS